MPRRAPSAALVEMGLRAVWEVAARPARSSCVAVPAETMRDVRRGAGALSSACCSARANSAMS